MSDYPPSKPTIKEESSTAVALLHNNYPCQLCPEQFSISRRLTEHTIICHPETRPYPCTKCRYRARTSAKLSRHLLTQHRKKTQLPLALMNQSYVNLHSNLQFRFYPDPLAIDTIQDYSSDQYYFDTARPLELLPPDPDPSLPSMPFNCGVCIQVFETIEKLQEHIKRAGHGLTVHKCKFTNCNYMTQRRAEWKRHMWSHKDEMMHLAVCSSCRKVNEMSTACRSRPFVCSLCKSRFTYQSKFREHCRAMHGLEMVEKEEEGIFKNGDQLNESNGSESQENSIESGFGEEYDESMMTDEEEEEDKKEFRVPNPSWRDEEDKSEKMEGNGTWLRPIDATGIEDKRKIGKSRKCGCLLCRFVRPLWRENFKSCSIV